MMNENDKKKSPHRKTSVTQQKKKKKKKCQFKGKKRTSKQGFYFYTIKYNGLYLSGREKNDEIEISRSTEGYIPSTTMTSFTLTLFLCS